MNAIRIAVLFACFVLSSCGRVPTSTVASRLGFSEGSVVAATVAVSTESGGFSTPKQIPVDRLPELWRALSHDAPPKTAVVSPHYYISLRARSGETLDIYIDDTTESYFRVSNRHGHEHSFRNRQLYDFAAQSFH